MHRTVRIRVADVDDLPRVLAFYETYREPHVLPRNPRSVGNAIEHRLLVIAEHAGEIVAVAGVWIVQGIMCGEFGGMLIKPDVDGKRGFRGYELQVLMLRLRLAILLARLGAEHTVATVISDDNDRSVSNALKTGFKRWPSPAAELLEDCSSCKKRPADGMCCSDFYQLPFDEVVAQVRSLLQETEHRHQVFLRGHSKDERLTAKIDVQAVTGLGRANLVDLVARLATRR